MKIKRKTLTRITGIAIKFSIVIVFLGSIYCYFGTQLFTIHSYQITGIDEDSRILIDAHLKEYNKQKVYYIFPADKIFTYSSTKIITTVRDTVPEMATINIRPVGLHVVKIEITLLKPLFRVSNSQAVTSDGIIFSTKYDIGKYPLISIASSATKNSKENGIIFTQLVVPNVEDTTELFNGLSELSSKISSIIFPVTNIDIERTGDVVYSNEKETSKIILLQETDFKKTWSTLVSAVDTDPLKSKLANNKEGLHYLDVRYGNKVFYRFNDMAFQNGSVTGILENHATSTYEVPKSTSTTTQ